MDYPPDSTTRTILDSSQRAQEVHRLQNRQKGRLVIFDIGRDQTIGLALHGGDHLDRVFVIAIVEIERLLNHALFNGGDFDKLQKVRDRRSGFRGRPVFFDKVKQGSDAVSSNIPLYPSGLDRCQQVSRRFIERFSLLQNIQENVYVDQYDGLIWHISLPGVSCSLVQIQPGTMCRSIAGQWGHYPTAPGPFVNLGSLLWGQKIIVHAFGQKYIYEVRSVWWWTKSDDLRPLQHEEHPWLTLITCRGYDEESDTYRWRTVVRAVQVSIEDE